MSTLKRTLLIYPGNLLLFNAGNCKEIKGALLNLHSYLKSHGIREVNILDLALELENYFSKEKELDFFKRMVWLSNTDKAETEIGNFRKVCIQILDEYDYDVVGISCYSIYNYQTSMIIGELCRKKNPDAIIVVGGWHCLGHPEDFFEPPGIFDFVVAGEGEKVLLDIVNGNIKKNEQFPEIIKGIPLDTGECEKHDYDFEEYLSDCKSVKKSIGIDELNINLSRRCPFKCSFCENRLIECGEWSAFSVEKCIKIIDNAIDVFPNLKTITFNEAVFGLKKQWYRDFVRELGKQDYPIAFATQTRIDILDEEDIALLKNSNLFIAFGIESLSERVLSAMNKSINPASYIRKILKNLSFLKKYNIPHIIYLILNHPGESEETLKETYYNLKDILDRKIMISFHEYNYWLPSFLDNYSLYHENFGSLFNGNRKWWKEVNPADTLRESCYAPSSIQGETLEDAVARCEKWSVFWHKFYMYYTQKGKPVHDIIEEWKRR
jgi:radical SAM superfamily enzyme YgiQ (UPF0313 family)